MSAHPHQPDEEGIPSYLGRLTQVPLLTVEQERALTLAVRRGDVEAKARLIEANMRLVINIAKGYRNRAISLEDLVQEGAIGLVQAAERFDPNRGYRFSTYATHWVRQAIGRAVDNKSKAIRLPAHVSQTLRRIERERARLARETGRDPTPEQLAAVIGITPKKLAALLQSSQDLLSLDMTVGENGGTTLGGLLRDTTNLDPERILLDEETQRELHRILMELEEGERRLVRLRFRLEDPPEESTPPEPKPARAREREMEVQAMKKLRAIAQRRRMLETLGEDPAPGTPPKDPSSNPDEAGR